MVLTAQAAPPLVDALIESFCLDVCELEALHDVIADRLADPRLDRAGRQQLLGVREAVEIALRVRL